MGYVLRDGISFCRIGERYVFLDYVEDRYFCLPDETNTAFRRLVDGDETACGRLAALRERGVLVPVPGANFPRAFERAGPPEASLLDRDVQSARVLLIAAALWHIATAYAGIRLRGLEAVLARVIVRKAASGRTDRYDGKSLSEVASSFERTARILRSHDQCLSRSIALTRLCAARGIGADLVIGVCLRPFGAHAWVEAAGVLINDRFDTVRRYTPIFAL